MVEDILKQNNLKVTKHRIEVYNIIKENNLITLKEIYDKLNIDKVTIYRIIKLYLKNNLIVKNSIDNDIFYSVNLKEHSHYTVKFISTNGFDYSKELKNYELVFSTN